MQAVRVATELEADASTQRHRELAHLGWQVASMVAGERVGAFDKYLRQLGLAPKASTQPSNAREKRRAQDNMRAVREAFARGAVRRGEA